jgi:hypothetical protein
MTDGGLEVERVEPLLMNSDQRTIKVIVKRFYIPEMLEGEWTLSMTEATLVDVVDSELRARLSG